MLFSIIIPVFNAEKYIGRCLESILAQSFKSYEIILINDSSFDKSNDICMEYCGKYSNICLLQTPHIGASGARNIGIGFANGEYLLFVDADDTIESKMLEHINNKIDKKNIDLCYMSRHYIVDKTGKHEHVVFRVKASIMPNYYNAQEFLHMVTKDMNSFPGSMWLIVCRRQFVVKNNIWLDEKIEWSEDSDFSYNLFTHADRIAVSDYLGYNWHIDNINSLTKRVDLNKILCRMDVYKKWYTYFSENESQKSRFAKEDRINMAQQMLYNYSLYLLQVGTMGNRELDKGLFRKLSSEKYIWKESTNKKFWFYKAFGLHIGVIKNYILSILKLIYRNIAK